jgi:hypothetical protein
MITHLDVCGQEQSSGWRRTQVDLGMKRLELLDWAASLLVGNEVSELAEDIPSHADHVLVAGRCPEVLKHRCGRIRLQVLVVGDELNDSVPHFRSDMVSRSRDELEDSVDVPLVLCRESFRKDRNLEHHLLSEVVVGDLKIFDQLANDDLRIGRVTHRVEQVESTSSDRDIAVLEGEDDGVLMFLDGLQGRGARGEMGHGVEAEITDVGLLGEDEATEEHRGIGDDCGFWIEVDS